jgi:hypothetical protein
MYAMTADLLVVERFAERRHHADFALFAVLDDLEQFRITLGQTPLLIDEVSAGQTAVALAVGRVTGDTDLVVGLLAGRGVSGCGRTLGNRIAGRGLLLSAGHGERGCVVQELIGHHELRSL